MIVYRLVSPQTNDMTHVNAQTRDGASELRADGQTQQIRVSFTSYRRRHAGDYHADKIITARVSKKEKSVCWESSPSPKNIVSSSPPVVLLDDI